MSPKMANTFCDTLTILDSLSQDAHGLTAGQIQKIMPVNTIGQVKRLLASLQLCGFVSAEELPHGRTGKVVYCMTENAAIMLASVARQYTEKY